MTQLWDASAWERYQIAVRGSFPRFGPMSIGPCRALLLLMSHLEPSSWTAPQGGRDFCTQSRRWRGPEYGDVGDSAHCAVCTPHHDSDALTSYGTRERTPERTRDPSN